MSLVGSLEDLGLGDILQIISLSRKSGVLWIRSPAGEGQVLFRDGLIRAVFSRGGPADLRDLVALATDVPKPELDAAADEARARLCPIGEVLAEKGLLSAEAQDDLLREHISQGVLAMFAWETGEFSFEISAGPDSVDEELFLAPGVNPQFLALEGTRIQDEGGRGELEGGAPLGLDAAFPSYADEAPGPSAPLPAEAVPLEAAELEHVGAPVAPGELVATGELEVEEAPLAEAVLLDDTGADDGVLEAVCLESEVGGRGGAPASDAEARAASSAPRAARAPSAARAHPPSREPTAPRLAPPVVVIDPDLAVLEWLKATLAVASRRVHIFQRPEQGISRIRQYLARAETPWVLLASDAPADPLSGARDAAELVRRLKSQAPRMPVFLLAREGGSAEARGNADAALAKPSTGMLADPRRARELADLADALVRALDRSASGSDPAEPAAIAGLPPDAWARLRELSARLRDPASQGEVLSLVMRFAAETFSRVAMFMLRDEQAVGMAQVGLPRAGGPDDAGIVEVVLPARESGWFRRVVESKAALRAAPQDEGDQRLAVLLGNALPREAYVAPIESGERVVALLYADNLPADTPIGDSAALEVVLHEAGLALDRAVLERALAEAERS